VVIGEQIRAARELIRWKQEDLAEASGLSIPTIKRLEAMRGEVSANHGTVTAIERALTDKGVVFISEDEASSGGGAGVRLRKW
tara:strand:+ start:415 stop:663 length:249 start_codon:yes stop_codon:yes gene_type:complete